MFGRKKYGNLDDDDVNMTEFTICYGGDLLFPYARLLLQDVFGSDSNAGTYVAPNLPGVHCL